jgi:hypothetical protein
MPATLQLRTVLISAGSPWPHLQHSVESRMTSMAQNVLVFLVLLTAGALGVPCGCSKSVSASTPALAEAEISDAPPESRDKYAALGLPTPLDVVIKSLSSDEIRIAGQVARDDAHRELVLRGLWLRDRAAESAAEVVPFVRMAEEAAAESSKASAADDDDPGGIVALSLAVLVQQWYRGAPIVVLAPALEAAALRLIESSDDLVHLQSAMLLWVMAEDGRGHTLFPAARQALREAEQNDALVHFMEVQRDEVLAKLR